MMQLCIFSSVIWRGASHGDHLAECLIAYCSLECYGVGLIYIDRLIKKVPNMKVNNLRCHRLLLCSMTPAAKFNDEDYFVNSFYAPVGGIHLRLR
jgi:hypothetical protein